MKTGGEALMHPDFFSLCDMIRSADIKIMIEEKLNYKSWQFKSLPKRILIIRLQAMGDVAITLPYVQSLKEKLPAITKLDFLTRNEVKDIPGSVKLYDWIYSIGGGRNTLLQLFCLLFLLPKLKINNYDIVIDLQRNKLSRLARKFIDPVAWSEIERFSETSAGNKYQKGIEAVGLGSIKLNTGLQLKKPEAGRIKLINAGWNSSKKLVVLNPAGAFSTRNWQIDNYVKYAELWKTNFPETQFLLLGLKTISEKALFLKKILKDDLIDLVNTEGTSVEDAFAIINKSYFILTEDSGLMHMSWVSGIPTLALFGSSRRDWSAPQGEHSLCLNSSDLECGNCLLEVCKYGDIHCLTRYTPEFVFDRAISLLKRIGKL
ncbi:MAG: glycosyltransferase family 9 protein [Candidatus Neomarinimicrobiota bacterium]|jgi:ADP-heptose:LPS heptosyltransferase